MGRLIKTSIAILIFIAGGLIYVIFRTQRLLMFSWFESLGFQDMVLSFRKYASFFNLPDWCIFSLPAGMWLLSYLLIIDVIWNKDKDASEYRTFVLVLPLLAILSEFCQSVHWLPGKFDWVDIICYCGAIIMYVSLNKYNYEDKKINFFLGLDSVCVLGWWFS